jgi:osmotically-inducible protein OsmY
MNGNIVLESEVKARIEAAFKHSAEADARAIRVEINDGKVMLRGRVRSWSERDEALQAAWAAPGVIEVDDRLDVALSSACQEI